MKKKLSIALGLALSCVLTLGTLVQAASTTSTKDVPVGSSSSIEMIGTIEPTIMSVTMPAFVPFNISNNISTQNKVISPRIKITNNSNVPVKVDVVYASVDMGKMKNTRWSNTGAVNDNQIAIGFKSETTVNQRPENLSSTKWLIANQVQDTNVMLLDANKEDAMYVVGTLGVMVAENATFNVTPTLVVSRTS